MEDTLQKGTKQALTEAGFELAQLVEAPIKENLMPSISIAKKEQTHVQDASAQNVISLSSAPIEIDDTNVEQEPKVVITIVLSSMLNMQTFPSMLGSSSSQHNFFEVNLSSIMGATISMPTFSVNSLIDTCPTLPIP